MLKPTRSRRHFYEEGMKRLALVVAGVGFVGPLIDLIIYQSLYHGGIQTTSIFMAVVCGIALIAFGFRAISYQILYLIASWAIFLGIVVFHLVFHPLFVELVPLTEHFFFRDLFILTCMLTLTCFIGTVKHVTFQGLGVMGFIMLNALLYKPPFVLKNAPFLLLVVGCQVIWLIFLAQSIRGFVNALHVHRKELESLNEEITQNMLLARDIQRTLLPTKNKMQARFKEYFVVNKPRDIVSGDFYWTKRADERILFAVGDCTGHGVSAAMVSLVCNSALNRSIEEFGLNTPNQVLDLSREMVAARFGEHRNAVMDGMDISLCCIQDENLMFAGANNPLWIIRSSDKVSPILDINGDTSQLESEDGEFRLYEIKGTKQSVGRVDEPADFQNHQLNLMEDDLIYLFTDGFADQFGGEDGKKFKSVNFKNLLLSLQHLDLAEQRSRLIQAFNSWKGTDDQVDDVCILGIRA